MNEKIDRKEIYRGKIIALRQDRVKKEEGSGKVRDVVVHPGAVVIVAVTKEQEIILVKQWRYAIERELVELPAGTLEKDETPDVCAQRELQEETGYRAGRLVSLGGFYSTPGFCTEYLHLFLALDLTPMPLPGDEEEGIELLFRDLSGLEKMIEGGEVCDAKTIAGIQRYAQWARKSST